MKVIFIVGARPQFIKLWPLWNLMKKNHNCIIIHTGQHYDYEMSDSFFYELNISKPLYNLNINNGLHGEQTGKMMIDLEKVIIKENPELIVVFGDTNSTLAGALVAAKLHIPIVHVEAGLRSFNMKMPEEINRIVVDHISDYLFAPTKNAMINLERENLISKSYLTGDIMVDSLKMALDNITKLKDVFFEKNSYYLLTLHRPYNVDNPSNLSCILTELSKLKKKVIFPVHPRTKNIIEQNNINVSKNISLIKPVGYLNFINLQANALKIITDSGGIQKEAYILKKPCITLRSETEWIETVEIGWNLLINPLSEKNYADKIEQFIPTGQYLPIFGENVVDKMYSIINSIKL